MNDDDVTGYGRLGAAMAREAMARRRAGIGRALVDPNYAAGLRDARAGLAETIMARLKRDRAEVRDAFRQIAQDELHGDVDIEEACGILDGAMAATPWPDL